MKTTKMMFISVLALGMIASVAKADFTFGTPTNLGPPVNSSAEDGGPSISADGLSLFFHINRPGGYGNLDLWVAMRGTTEDDWGEPTNLGPMVNSSSDDGSPGISADGLSLYFSSGRPGGSGNADLWVATRPTTAADWGTPVNLGPTVNSGAGEVWPSISADGLQLYFSEWEVYRPGGYGDSDMWVTTRHTVSDPWATPVNLGPIVNSSARDTSPSISADGLSLFFHSNRLGGYGDGDLWITTRATKDDDWGAPVNLGPPVNSSAEEGAPSISADGLSLFFHSNRPGGFGSWDLWQVPIEPIVDLNGDGIVDSVDMCMMVDHWGENYPLCDIGPMPWGDGIVDVQDLIVLAEHLFTYPGAVAHWKLDETEGLLAYDSAGNNDASVFGPVWQPDGGMVAGALQFDGIDDYVSTEFVLDPADGEFSFFAWIKGGGPGQVIISQTDGTGMGATSLSADPTDGKLMTKLMPPAMGLRVPPQPLVSEFVITDGNWHRIGFVWDGSYRCLYVDGAEVAKDTKSFSMLESSDGGLHLGAGKNLDPGTFWLGLIDDVRIYNRAITP
jgi:Tol biopolymer transport system component